MVGLEGSLGRVGQKGEGGSPKVLSREVTGWPELWRPQKGERGRVCALGGCCGLLHCSLVARGREYVRMSAGTG